jgi:hypothetical protein
MRTLEDSWLDIERQRAGMAVNGIPPAITEVQCDLTEDHESYMVVVGLSDGNYIASAFDLASLDGFANVAMVGALRALNNGLREARATFAAEVEQAAMAKLDEGGVR